MKAREQDLEVVAGEEGEGHRSRAGLEAAEDHLIDHQLGAEGEERGGGLQQDAPPRAWDIEERHGDERSVLPADERHQAADQSEQQPASPSPRVPP